MSELTWQQLFRYWFYYDSETGLLYKRNTKNVSIGYKNPKGYIQFTFKSQTFLVHRIIWIYTYGDIPENIEIDHINGNRSDNKIENLRLATKSENIQNSKIRKDNISKVKGIGWHEQSQKWQARITLNHSRITLGLFSSIEEAKRVIETERKRLHGIFCNLGKEG